MNRSAPTMDATARTAMRPESAPEEPDDQTPPSARPSTAKTPQEFYAEVTRRPDVRAILEELADR